MFLNRMLTGCKYDFSLGMSTQDHYAIGDLLGKYKDGTEYLNHKYLLPGLANELSGSYWDVFLPLSGKHSVMHRSVVITR